MEKKYLQLNDISSYKFAFSLSNYIWNIIIGWDYVAKDTIGKQFVRAMDSVSANIAEGFGRYSKKDKVKFYRYSYGSIQEALDWNEKARARKLLTEDQYKKIFLELKKMPADINSLIRFTNERLSI